VDMEEERRLCYVGMTRAKEMLILLGGQPQSCFLQDLPEVHIQRGKALQRTPKVRQLSLF